MSSLSSALSAAVASGSLLESAKTNIESLLAGSASEVAARVLAGLEQLRGCDAFFSVIISADDEQVLRRLGINVCCEPKFERSTLFHA